MDSLEALGKRARRVRSFFKVSTSNSDEELDEDDLSLAYRLLRLVKVALVIVATALTIARMLGWL
jgi:hypothetical protein